MSKQVETHGYVPDTSLRRDWSGSFPCRCGLPRKNQHHKDVPSDADEEAKALEARKIGDHDPAPVVPLHPTQEAEIK